MEPGTLLHRSGIQGRGIEQYSQYLKKYNYLINITIHVKMYLNI